MTQVPVEGKEIQVEQLQNFSQISTQALVKMLMFWLDFKV